MRTEADVRRPLQVYGFMPQVLAAVKFLTPVQALLKAGVLSDDFWIW